MIWGKHPTCFECARHRVSFQISINPIHKGGRHKPCLKHRRKSIKLDISSLQDCPVIKLPCPQIPVQPSNQSNTELQKVRMLLERGTQPSHFISQCIPTFGISVSFNDPKSHPKHREKQIKLILYPRKRKNDAGKI